MAKILVIESYLSNKFSISEYATEKFVKEYKNNNPNDEIKILDLNKEKKLENVLSMNNFSTFWDEQSDKYIEMIKESDKIIISTGMVNFTISPLLKNFLDNILLANKTFKYKYDGSNTSVGLIDSNKKVLLIMAQGSYKNWYKFSAFDDYLIDILHFIGIDKKNIQLLLFDGTKTNDQINLNIEEKFNLKIDDFNQILKNF